MAGEKDPFPYPDNLLRGFNQLILTCALRDVPRAQQPASIPEFVANLGYPSYTGVGREARRAS